MKNQNDGNISELEMVGAMLFGSIADEASAEETETESKVKKTSRKVNLGAKIAPETSRQWEEEPQQVVLSAADETMISEILPEHHNPSPVSDQIDSEMEARKKCEARQNAEVESIIHPVKPAKQVNWAMRIYGVSLTLMTLCVVVLGWQLFVEKNGSSGEISCKTPATQAPMTETEAPMVETVEEPVTSVPESAFAAVQIEDASKLAESNPLPTPEMTSPALPDVNEAVGTEMAEVPTYQAYGGSATVEEEYPTFNAEEVSALSVQAPISAQPVQVPAQSQVPVAVPPAQYVSTTAWNAGETMEEIPVFNSELSSFSPAPAAPEVAPLAPQVGAQATLPTSLPQYSAPAQSPHKIAPPAAPSPAPFSTESDEEEYPSFNPNMGVDGALPVSYY